MAQMLSGLQHISTIDVSSFDTSKVTDMSYMFQFSGYTSLDLSNFDFSLVTTTYRMFAILPNMTTLVLPQNANTTQLTDVGLMFASCSSITSLDLSGWKFDNITNMIGMFCRCESLITLSLPSASFGTYLRTISGNIDDIYISSTNVGLFDRCFALTVINNLSSLVTPLITDFTATFNNCYNLTSIDIHNFIVPNGATVTNMLNLGVNNNRGVVTIILPQTIDTNITAFADNKT